MKKIIAIISVLLIVGALFAGSFTPYLLTLDLHPGILSGWCPTYAGVGGDYAFYLSNNDVIHANLSIAGGITERALFQNPSTGQYLMLGDPDVELVDIVSLAWDAKVLYDLSDKLTFSFGYRGIFEKRQDSMLVTGKYWPANQNTDRWLGGTSKTSAENMKTLAAWFSGFGTTAEASTVYPEFDTDISVFHTFHSEVEFNMMEDTMVANNGFLAKSKITYVPGFMNKNANLFSADVDFIAAKKFVDIRNKKNLNLFAVSIINRTNFNVTVGDLIPTVFQQSVSLGRKVRGFDTGSYGSTFTAVNNFEIRLSGPEPIDGVFLRTNVFFDCGIGFGKLFNTDINLEKPNILASVGVQEQIDYNDAFDLGIEVAYLITGQNARNPYAPLQIGATFFLDF